MFHLSGLADSSGVAHLTPHYKLWQRLLSFAFPFRFHSDAVRTAARKRAVPAHFPGSDDGGRRLDALNGGRVLGGRGNTAGTVYSSVMVEIGPARRIWTIIQIYTHHNFNVF